MAVVVLAFAGAAAFGADAKEANPLYAGWAAAKDKTVTFDRVEEMSGGAPIPGGRAPVASTVTYTLTDLTPELATLKVTGGAPQTMVVTATMAPGDPVYLTAAGQEDVKVGAKTYACKVYKYQTRDKAELGRDSQGMPGEVTVWLCPDVPGGIVRREVSLTIRVSYDTVDTIVVK